ncbi:MAG: DegT/DnrJ/EryC1/StrS family aminotransferase [Planctomycetota bacterium]
MSEADLPIIRPTLPPLGEVAALLEGSYESGMVTVGPLVRRLENKAREATGAREVVAFSSCTSALMLAWRALELEPGSEVICPSFTFAATAHAIVWNSLVPVFVDCLPGTCTVDPAEVEKAVTPKTAAVCPVYTFGLPPDIGPLDDIAKRKGLPLVFDSAQGLGSTYGDRPAGGFGLAECFSMSPTKVVTAVEGGLFTTDNADLAGRLRSLRDYGKALDGPLAGEDMARVGLSARMSELHAAVGLLNLRRRDGLIAARHRLIEAYRERLGALPGCSVQDFPPDRTTSGNYFVLFIAPGARRPRDEVARALKEQGIQTKRYFHPPVHEHTGQKRYPMRVVGDLPRTRETSRAGLALPLYSHMTDEDQQRVIGAVESLLGT